ncbi:MAG: phasin family protein [Pseudomonadota bacterium]
MANDKKNSTDRVSDKMTDKAGEIARNIWLAGVGAYGKAVDEAQGRLEKAGMETPKLFRDLVKAGAALEEEARDAIEAGQAARNSVEERISRVRENFNMQRPVRGEDLVALHEKIDRLATQVAALTEALDKGARAAPKRKVTASKKMPRKTPTKNSVARAKAASASSSKSTSGTAATAKAAKKKQRTTRR